MEKESSTFNRRNLKEGSTSDSIQVTLSVNGPNKAISVLVVGFRSINKGLRVIFYGF